MKDKETKTFFELFNIVYTFKGDKPPEYPSFDVCVYRIGAFSTLAGAEQGIKDWIDGYETPETQDENEHVALRHNYIFGFLIEEHLFDVCDGGYRRWCNESKRNYLHDGTLLDECLTSALLVDPFLGRTPDRVRFNAGDLVEVLHEDNDTVTLEMVVRPPMTPEEVTEYNLKQEDKRVRTSLTAHSDCYYTFSTNGKKNNYSEPEAIHVFPLRFPVSDDIGKQLEARYKNGRNKKRSWQRIIGTN
jgi:hypothetical protein